MKKVEKLSVMLLVSFALFMVATYFYFDESLASKVSLSPDVETVSGEFIVVENGVSLERAEVGEKPLEFPVGRNTYQDIIAGLLLLTGFFVFVIVVILAVISYKHNHLVESLPHHRKHRR